MTCFTILTRISSPLLLSSYPWEKQTISCSTSSAYTCFRELFLTNPPLCIQRVAQHQIFPSLHDAILNFTWRCVKAFGWHQKYSRLLLPKRKKKPIGLLNHAFQDLRNLIWQLKVHMAHIFLWNGKINFTTWHSPGVQEVINKTTLKGANRNKCP